MRVYPAPPTSRREKDLRRLPHVFSKVLELPLPADGDVAVFEGSDAFHFVVAGAAVSSGGAVQVRTVRIHPGVIKVVVRADAGRGEGAAVDDDDMELDRWRFRLPEACRPAMAAAGYVNGQLVVMVPKGPAADGEDGGDGIWRCCNGGGRRINERLVVVQ